MEKPLASLPTPVREAFAGAALAALCAPPLPAQCDLVETQKLYSVDPELGGRFGNAVAMDGDRAIVGSVGDDEHGLSSGSAEVVRFDGTDWVHQQKLLPADGGPQHEFGSSVAIDGELVVAGAPGRGSMRGAAYVYRFDGATWQHDATLTASNGADFDLFGLSVAASGATVAVGAATDELGADSGSVYLFRHDGTDWIETQQLFASDGAAFDAFVECALHGDWLLVGAAGDSHAGGAFAGSVYFFRFDGSAWIEDRKLTASDARAFASFGSCLSLDQGIALIGAENDSQLGAAYVFRLAGGSWVEAAALRASDGELDDVFGSAVAVQGCDALVGARLDDDMGFAAGAVYHFREEGGVWTQRDKVYATDAVPQGIFGDVVVLDGSRALVGSQNDADHFVNSGAVYALELDCTLAEFCFMSGKWRGASATAGSVAETCASDDQRWCAESFPAALPPRAPLEAFLCTTVTPSAPIRLCVSVEASVDDPALAGARGELRLRNQRTGAYTLVAEGPLSTRDSLFAGSPAADPSDFVGAGGEVEIRFTVEATPGITGWSACIDRATVRVQG